ncbi:hypothetical protein BH23CHL2_BH23CHL2_36690 [soil metagenome]
MLDRLALLSRLSGLAGEVKPEAAALEYSRVVLQLVPPYASLFLDEEAMLNSNHAEQVELEYRRGGFLINPDWRAGPADHLGLELYFLAHLYAVDAAPAARFLSDYLMPWAPICLLSIARVESARLYPGLASTTLEVIGELSRRE